MLVMSGDIDWNLTSDLFVKVAVDRYNTNDHFIQCYVYIALFL